MVEKKKQVDREEGSRKKRWNDGTEEEQMN